MTARKNILNDREWLQNIVTENIYAYAIFKFCINLFYAWKRLNTLAETGEK